MKTFGLTPAAPSPPFVWSRMSNPKSRRVAPASEIEHADPADAMFIRSNPNYLSVASAICTEGRRGTEKPRLPRAVLTTPVGRLPTTLGILLLYYPAYAESAIEIFVDLLRRVDCDARCLLVFNNSTLMASGVGAAWPCIAGDNTLHEFSGWDTGIEYARANGMMPERGVVIVANDTFCHHNRFGPLSKWAFVSAFRRMERQPNEPTMAGDVQCGLSTFSVGGLACPNWISSYLFGIDAMLLWRLGKISPPQHIVNGVYPSPDPEAMIDEDVASPTLRQHIKRWLFPAEGQDGWYGARQLDAGEEPRHVAKIRAILAEKSLSARVLNAGGRLLPVFPSQWVAWLRKLERRAQHEPRENKETRLERGK